MLCTGFEALVANLMPRLPTGHSFISTVPTFLFVEM